MDVIVSPIVASALVMLVVRTGAIAVADRIEDADRRAQNRRRQFASAHE